MSSSIKNVIVAGASGNLGPHVLNALHSAEFSISALVRPSSASITLPSYVKTVQTDYTVESLAKIFQGQDAVVSCVGAAGVSSQFAMIDAAEQAGVKRFIPSEWGWAMDRPLLDEIKQRLAEKEKVLQHLKDVCSRSKTMSWTAVATGPFFDWVIMKAPALGFNVAQKKARIIDGGNEPVTGSTGAAIGQAAVGVLKHPEESANQVLKVYSLEFTQQTLLSALERATGSTWEVESCTTAELIEHKKAQFAEKNFLGAFIDVLGQQMMEGGSGRGRHLQEGESANQLLGVEKENLDSVIASFLKEA